MIPTKVIGTALIGIPLVMIINLPLSANPSKENSSKNSSITAKAATEDQTFILNPNPSIFSEAPYNRSQIQLAEKLRATKQLQTPAKNSEPETKPWSEAQENRLALVKAINGQFNVRLLNLTNTEVTYELVGHTNQRQLTGNTSFLLQDLAMPVTVTVLREDGGLVKITPKPAAPGILELRLDEALNLDQDRRAVRVREGGSLLIY